jgi:hypothetical protein
MPDFVRVIFSRDEEGHFHRLYPIIEETDALEEPHERFMQEMTGKDFNSLRRENFLGALRGIGAI